MEYIYHNAVELVQHEPRAFGDLEEIYNNPSYYSSWYLRSMHENLGLNGSVPAEQNHASICAHIGNGGNFAICEHINKLHDRQIDLTKKRMKKEHFLRSTIRNHKSTFVSNIAHIDVAARKMLSDKSYKIFCIELRKILVKDTEDGFYHVYEAKWDKHNREQCHNYQKNQSWRKMYLFICIFFQHTMQTQNSNL